MHMNSVNLSRRALVALSALAAGLALAPTTALADPSTEELQAQLEEARSQLAAMGDGLASLQDQLASQNEAVEATRGAIWEIEGKISDTQTQLDGKRTQLSGRMRSAYKGGASSTLDLLLGSSSVEELVSNVYYLDKANEADAQVISEVRELEGQLQQQKGDLEGQQAEQEEQLADTQRSLDSYQAEVASAQSYFNSLDAQVQASLAAEAEAERQAALESGDAAGSLTNAVTTVENTNKAQQEQGGTDAPGGEAQTPAEPEEPSAPEASPDPEPEPEPTPEPAPAPSAPAEPSAPSTPSSPGVAHYDIISNAETMIGKPYKQWQAGVNYGPGADGYDCCGLVATAYRLSGYALPYQAPVLQLMSYIKGRGNWKDCDSSNYQSVLAPGDVIFCSTGHVAVYAGGNKMIHAPYVGAYVCYATVYNCIGGGFGG